MRRPNQQHGLSLVELMVALVIGLILTAGVIHVFLGNQAAYRETQRFSALQDNIGFAVDFMVRDIRGADTIAETTTPQGISVIRDRDAAVCNVTGAGSEVIYHVDGDALRCGPNGDGTDSILVQGMRQGSILDVETIPGPSGTEPIGAEITLIFTSQANQGGPPRHHTLTFHVALRGPIFRSLTNL
ncbi:PilW family protein [Ectothiorhodospira variabilis]|uniref:PilW family protein n=1 Tax=Ectothiorhodospira variabilis TaxID=505694 RepID=UPI001EFB8873|nr:prepilin-type N-terminal cleavage/methylation domain-containing protein [Ectothiorhodospira variabilis]MCG5493556.1 prepilin-type N-terminal cleavage/methylation domain-containing protein [Ectothiorhodospira variabilis]MCG5502885.1 prepilin-type N-terminal cleavage/methylation domain-containing protein [Ectothiorhodospira variabilis]MCG5506327.1 prepilin-type N-terminal cleavage/methylation domain-containing protein [Ectothiorhodospira variabilis]